MNNRKDKNVVTMGIGIRDAIYLKKHGVLLIRFGSKENIRRGNIVAIDDNGNLIWKSKLEDGVCVGMMQIDESRFQLIYDDRYIVCQIVDGKIEGIFRKIIYRENKNTYKECVSGLLEQFFG